MNRPRNHTPSANPIAVDAGARSCSPAVGTGTVQAVIAGLPGSAAAVAVLPAGTGNLPAGNVGLAGGPGTCRRTRGGRCRRAVDVGVVDGQVFAVRAGMGFDVAMMGDVSDRLKATIGPVACVLSGFTHL